MHNNWAKYPFKVLLDLISRPERVESTVEYKILGEKWYAKGLYIKLVKNGLDVRAERLYLACEGDFIYNRLFAWKGSFAIVPKELDGCYVSNEYMTFLIDEQKINPKYLMWYLSRSEFWDEASILSKGVSSISRNRLGVEKFLEIRIPVPSLEEQLQLVDQFGEISARIDEVERTAGDAYLLCQKLRQAILREGFSGNLVSQDPNDEPASELLKKINIQKELQIEAEKVKKGDYSQLISEDRIDFELPKGWVLTRLRDVVQFNPRSLLENDLEVSFVPMRLIDDGFKNNHSFEIRKWSEIKNGFTHFKERDVVFAKITPCFENRKSAIMSNLKNQAGAGTTELIVMRTFKELVVPEFLLFLVKTDKFIELGLSSFTGTAGQQRVQIEKIKDLVIWLPPLSEQKRIVQKLEQSMKLCDEIDQRIKENQESSKLLMETMLREAFTS